MNWLCRLFGHRLNTGSGPSEAHWCSRSWGRGQWAGDCDWCNCKAHGCADCHGRDYVPPPAYMWCVQRGGSGDPTITGGDYHRFLGSLTDSQKSYLRDYRARYPFQLHPDVIAAIDELEVPRK